MIAESACKICFDCRM